MRRVLVKIREDDELGHAVRAEGQFGLVWVGVRDFWGCCKGGAEEGNTLVLEDGLL
jgi:hypothetical protein